MDEESDWHDKVGMKVVGKEGLVVEKPDLMDKYCRKHKSVGKISPSQFAKIFESISKIPKNYTEDDTDNEEDPLQHAWRAEHRRGQGVPFAGVALEAGGCDRAHHRQARARALAGAVGGAAGANAAAEAPAPAWAGAGGESRAVVGARC